MTLRLLFFYLIFICSHISSFSQDKDEKEVQNWNGQATVVLENDSTHKDLQLLDTLDKDYRVFFAGENHLFKKSNAQLQLKFIKYLHQTHGVNTILLEFGYSRGWLVTQYITTGDTSYLNVLKRYSFESYIDLYQGLREYNQTLDSANKIRVEGIDVERFFILSTKVMSILMPDKTPHDSISVSVESIHGLATYNDHLFQKKNTSGESGDDIYERYPYPMYSYSSLETLSLVIKNFKRNKEKFKEYVGDQFPVFEKTMLELEEKIRYSNYVNRRMVQQYVFRETYMYKRFMEVFERDPSSRFYAQFGRCHSARITQEEACTWYNYNSIASRINNSDDPRVNGKVCSIGMFYPLSKNYHKNKQVNTQLERLVKASVKDSLTLFKLQPDTTVSEDDDLSRKFQYIIINHISPAHEKAKSSDEEEEYMEHSHFDIGTGLFLSSTDDFRKQSVAQLSRSWWEYTPYIKLTSGAFESRGWATGAHFQYYIPQNMDMIDQGILKLRGYSLLYSAGYNYIENDKALLSTEAMFGFGRMKLKAEDPGQIYLNSFNNTEHNKLTNPAFLMGAKAELRIIGKSTSFGIVAQYIYDISSGGWKDKDGNVGGPEWSFTGLQAEIFYSFKLMGE